MRYYTLLLSFFIMGVSYAQNSVPDQLKTIKEHIQQDDYTMGITLLDQLVTQNPYDNTIYRYYAELLLEIDMVDSAISNIQEALRLSQNNPENHIIAGNIYRAQKDYLKAKESYEKAITLAPGTAQVYYEYATLNIDFKYLNEAERLLNLSINFEPQSWENIILKAKLATERKQFTQAQNLFFEAVERFSYEETVLAEFADFYIQRKLYNKAIEVLKETNIRFGDSSRRNKILGDLLFIQGRYEESLQYYTLSDQNQGSSPFPVPHALKWKLYNLSKITGDMDTAHRYLKEAFELSPNNQLYISTFYNYLMTLPEGDITRLALSRFLEKKADLLGKKGVGLYYITILQRIVFLDPTNTKIRSKLINYARLYNNEYRIDSLLRANATYDPQNTGLSNSILLREHLQKTSRLDINPKKEYIYTNKIYIDNNLGFLVDTIKNDIEFINTFFNGVVYSVNTSVPFAAETKNIFQNNTNYNIITHASIQEDGSEVSIQVYDKTGYPIRRDSDFYNEALLTESIINHIEKSVANTPPIGLLLERLPNSTFRINLGTKLNITNNSSLVIMNKDFEPIVTATVTEVLPETAIIKQDGVSQDFFNFEESFIVPLKYVPSLNTNTNVTPMSTGITNILQISQKRYSATVDFSSLN